MVKTAALLAEALRKSILENGVGFEVNLTDLVACMVIPQSLQVLAATLNMQLNREEA